MATRTALGAGLVVGTLVLSIVGVAEAQAPRSATPIQCLQAWDQDGISVDYVGDGWVEAPVADINGIFLGCGDATTGMVHIAHPDTTGSLHPVYADTQVVFLRCFELIASSGAETC